jgi:hypothetical protein
VEWRASVVGEDELLVGNLSPALAPVAQHLA